MSSFPETMTIYPSFCDGSSASVIYFSRKIENTVLILCVAGHACKSEKLTYLTKL